MNQTYTVKAGDTLYGISNQFGVSVTELAELNNVIGTNLKIGQVLTIPSKSGTNPNNLFMYTVKSGDTLYGIARKYNTTAQKIRDLNYLKNDNLSIGQVIRIPEMYTPEDEMIMPNYKNYIVQKGDTLYSIARNNNIDVNTLIKDNGLQNNNLSLGQIIRIRIPSSEVEIEECIGPDYIPPETTPTIIYTVKSGDSLYKIANRYNTSVSVLQSLNNLTSNNLSIGQQLKIPASSTSSSNTYTVKSGDNLYSIARKFNTTVDAIKRKNNLKTTVLSVGQILKI
ncbi:MAG: LysM peptidoglycan-binding domain-containing protein [Bacilli bacterium]|nr:LysM peptidoglycan-binding domain-containing protein [Bacilli bacterium]